MKKLALSGLEAAINRCLDLDPAIREQLQPLADKVIKIELTDLKLAFFVIIQPDGIELQDELESPANTIISGTLPSFIKVAINRGSQASVFSSEMTISGDIGVGEKLSDIFRHINVDWEYHLAQLTGDTLSHKIMYHGKQLKSAMCRVVESLGGNTKEYVFHEARYLPESSEVEQLYYQINLLRQDIERAEARLQRLQSRLNQEPTT